MHARRHSLLCQVAAAALLVQITVNQAGLIPDHARSRLLGSEINSMYKDERQIHSKFYVKPRDTLWWGSVCAVISNYLHLWAGLSPDCLISVAGLKPS